MVYLKINHYVAAGGTEQRNLSSAMVVKIRTWLMTATWSWVMVTTDREEVVVLLKQGTTQYRNVPIINLAAAVIYNPCIYLYVVSCVSIYLFP